MGRRPQPQARGPPTPPSQSAPEIKPNKDKKEARDRQQFKGGDRSKGTTKPSKNTDESSPTLYDLLGVPRDASARDITAAYRRKALLCHPDKVMQMKNKPDDSQSDDQGSISVEEATRHFQKLQAAYAVLNDPKKRQLYDRTGETGDEALSGQSYEEAYEFYRTLYPEVTVDAIEQFKTQYIGSTDEKEDIQDFVERFEGDLSKFFEFIPLSDPADAPRYKRILAALVKEKRITATPAYTRTLKEFNAIAEMYEKRFAKESKQSHTKRKAQADSDAALALAIKANMKNRDAASNNFLDELSRKYAKKGKKC